MKLLQISTLEERNVINVPIIDEYVKKLAAEAPYPEAKTWFLKTLRKWLVGNYQGATKVETLPDGAPEWMAKAQHAGDDLWEVQITDRVDRELHHVLDYFRAHPNDHFERGNVDQVVAASKQWTKNAIEKDRKFLEKNKAKEEGSEALKKMKVVMAFPEKGMYIVDLQTEAELKEEGNRMNHCVGSYCDSVNNQKLKIYSLRDAKNEPHATLELKLPSMNVNQIKGKGNHPPVAKYIDPILQFIKKNGYEVIGDASNVGLYKIDGKLYSPNELPANSIINVRNAVITSIDQMANGLTFQGNLTVVDVRMSTLPDNLTVNGALQIKNSKKLKSMGTGLKVTGAVHMENSYILFIPADAEMSSLYAEKSKIRKLPPNFKVTDLSLDYCTGIKELPTGLVIGDDLDLEGSGITKLSAGLVVKGTLNVSNTDIETLPDGLEAGRLDIENTKIKVLPKNMKISGAIYDFDGNEEDYPEYRFT